MNKHFGYVHFDEEGLGRAIDRKGLYADMLMDIWARRMKRGESLTICLPEDELALDLLQGSIRIAGDLGASVLTRSSFIRDGFYGAHVCRGRKLEIEALQDSEILFMATDNPKEFEAAIYTPENTRVSVPCKGLWNGTAERVVRTAFEYPDEPASKLVLGETIMEGGRWSGYVPHYHPQPEVYYFHSEHPDAFGASFVGEEVFKIKDHSFCAVDANLVHPQVAAPGYAIGFVWVIRHLDGNPWLREECKNEHVHEWLLNDAPPVT